MGPRSSSAPAPERTVQPADLPQTLLGRAPTQVEAAAASRSRRPSPGGPIPRPRRPSPLVYAAGVGVLVAAGGLAWMLMPHHGGKGTDVGSPQLGTLKTQLLASQVQLAQKALEDKDYKGATSHAAEALKLDPANVDARRVEEKARLALGELDTTAGSVRDALKAGDYSAAARGLEKLLSLDPNHPAVADLSAQLNKHFRSQADEARQTARGAQGAAAQARAKALPDYAAAAALSREGESAFGRGEYAVAARKWLDARDGFERAQRAAAEARAAQTPPPATTTLPAATPLPTLPPATQPPPTQAPATLPPQTAPPPPTQPPPPVSEEPAIRRTVAEYGRAIEQRDLTLFRRLKPNLTDDEERRLKEAFDVAPSDSVRIDIKDLKISGNRATVRLDRRDTIGGRVQTLQQTLLLSKGPSGWTIQQIGR